MDICLLGISTKLPNQTKQAISKHTCYDTEKQQHMTIRSFQLLCIISIAIIKTMNLRTTFGKKKRGSNIDGLLHFSFFLKKKNGGHLGGSVG